MLFFKKSSPPSPTPVPPPAAALPSPARPAAVVPPPAAATVLAPVVSIATSPALEPGQPPAIAAPRGFAPPSGLPLQRKMKRLQKQLRSTSHALAKRRWQPVTLACTHAPSLPELPALAEAAPPAVADATAPAPAENPAPEPVPEPVPAPDTRLVELQYEVLDLRHKIEALSATPMLDAAAVTTLTAKAPAFTEVQYEVADLRHQVQTLQAELAALKAPVSPAALKASQLEIADGQGRTVASISADGVISCSSVVLRANT